MFWYLFACNLLIPAMMIIGGYWMKKRPPRQINGLVGYRTTRSMKNMETWKFAHDLCGKLWLRIGLILLIPTLVAQLSLLHSADDDLIGVVSLIIVGVQLAALILPIIPVERALKKTFDDDGNRRV